MRAHIKKYSWILKYLGVVIGLVLVYIIGYIIGINLHNLII